MAGVGEKSFVLLKCSLKSLIGIAEEQAGQMGQTLCMWSINFWRDIY